MNAINSEASVFVPRADVAEGIVYPSMQTTQQLMQMRREDNWPALANARGRAAFHGLTGGMIYTGFVEGFNGADISSEAMTTHAAFIAKNSELNGHASSDELIAVIAHLGVTHEVAYDAGELALELGHVTEDMIYVEAELGPRHTALQRALARFKGSLSGIKHVSTNALTKSKGKPA